MPDLNELLQQRNTKKFVKKNYRPWDLSGNLNEVVHTFPVESQAATNAANSIENILDINLGNNLDSIVATANQNSFNKVSQPNENAQDSSKDHILEADTPGFKNQQHNNDSERLTLLENNLGNNKGTYREHLENVQGTLREHTGNTKVTTLETNREQLGNDLDPTTLSNRVLCLTGIQEKILELVCSECALIGQPNTGPLETSKVAQYLKISVASTKTSIKRLIDKGFVSRSKGRTSRGGYIILGVSKEVQEIMENRKKSFEKRFNQLEYPISIGKQLREQLDNNTSSISSNSIITTTKETIPEEWLNIDYEALIPIGFSKTQIKQLAGRADLDIVQESIYHFAFGLENNQKLKKYEDPLNVLMGVLRKGQAWFEKDYKSPKEIAQLQLIELKKAQIERVKKIEEEAYSLALEEWKHGLSTDDIEKIESTSKKHGNVKTPQNVILSLYFKQHVWQSKKTEFLV